MRLYIPTMDAVLVEVAEDGRVRFDQEDWMQPTAQELRAILHAAHEQLEDLKELVDVLTPGRDGGPTVPATPGPR
jgi:hypothetical protein